MTIEDLNQICRNSFIDHIGIRFTNFNGSEITGELQITPIHLQPAGYVHGGVYISMAETLAGAGSLMLLNGDDKIPFGVIVNSQHLASATGGKIIATGELLFNSSFKHIWDIKITDESGKLISVSRVTNNIKNNSSENQNGISR
jgi:1,4-dihydroxy-2-naphthoyl-CoA hydrolase